MELGVGLAHPSFMKNLSVKKGLELVTSISQLTWEDDLESVSTEEILKKMRQLGVKTITREAFVQQAITHKSFIEIANLWRKQVKRPLEIDEDFYLCTVVEVLWSRWCPEQVPIERVLECLDEAYQNLEEDDDAQAIEAFWEAWQALTYHLTPEMTTLEKAEVLLQDSGFSMSEFIIHFDIALSEPAIENEKYLQIALQFSEQVVAQFSSERMILRNSFSKSPLRGNGRKAFDSAPW